MRHSLLPAQLPPAWLQHPTLSVTPPGPRVRLSVLSRNTPHTAQHWSAGCAGGMDTQTLPCQVMGYTAVSIVGRLSLGGSFIWFIWCEESITLAGT